MLEALRLGIAHNARVEGLVHLFVTVPAEAIDETHPRHVSFKDRYRRLIELVRLRIQVGQETGGLTSGIDPTLAAQMLVALADGLQVQWLLDPESRPDRFDGPARRFDLPASGPQLNLAANCRPHAYSAVGTV